MVGQLINATTGHGRTVTDLELAGQTGEVITPSLEEIVAQAKLTSLTRDNPALADLPAWFEGLRDHQRVAVREILTAYEEGAECVVLDAPTGSGKTLIGETVRRLLAGDPYNRASQSTYVCSSKSLQDQFLRDYPYAKVLKGRSNYPTESYPERFYSDGLSAADCTKTPGDSDSCMWCIRTSECPYEQAKSAALRSDLAVVNTSYFLSECNGPGRFSGVDGRGRGGFIIADEADTLEKELMSHVEVRISERRLKQYGLGVPKYVTKEESWREWAEEAYEKVRANRKVVHTTDNIKAVRERKRHDILVQKLDQLRKGLGDGGWVYTGDRQSVAFKPVTVNQLGQEKFWQHGNKWLLMSATVISADELLESLGWDDEREWRLVRVPSTFKPENRKVIVWPVASMTYKERDESYPKIAAAVQTIADRYPEDRILVHSTSYDLTKYLVGELLVAGATKNPSLCNACEGYGLFDGTHNCPTCKGIGELTLTRSVISYSSASEKDGALKDYLCTPNAILVAPSLDRGVDLPGDACRVQIICKVPFLNLKDKQVSGRLYGGGREGKIWYSVNAIRTIVQMTGRAVRSEEDWAVAYILDGQFVTNVWNNYKRLIPAWWKEGLEWRMKGL